MNILARSKSKIIARKSRRRRKSIVTINEAQAALEKVRENPALLKASIEVRMFGGGMVVRFRKKNAKASDAKKSELKISEGGQNFSGRYIAAVEQMYQTDSLVTENLVNTVKKTLSEKERAFYSSIGAKQ